MGTWQPYCHPSECLPNLPFFCPGSRRCVLNRPLKKDIAPKLLLILIRARYSERSCMPNTPEQSPALWDKAVSPEKSTQTFHSYFQHCLLPRGGAHWSINNNKHKFQTQQRFTCSAPPTYLQIKCFMRGLAKLGEAMPGCRILEDNKDLGTKPILQPLREEGIWEKDKSDWACLGQCVCTLALFHYNTNKKPFPDKTFSQPQPESRKPMSPAPRSG